MIEMFKSLHFWRVWLVPHLLLAVSIAMGWFGWEAAAAFFVFYTLISGLGVAVGFHSPFHTRLNYIAVFIHKLGFYQPALPFFQIIHRRFG